MGLKIKNIVNVVLNALPKGATRKDFGTVAIITPEQGNVFTNKKTRYAYVNGQEDVVAMFGVDSETAKCSEAFFAQSPRAKQLIIMRWQKDGATIDATKNQLQGATINTPLEAFKQVKNGAFSLYVGDELKQLTDIDLSKAQSLAAIADAITEALSGSDVTCAYDQIGGRFVLASTISGASAETVIYPAFADSTPGDYIGGMLKLEDGQATQIIGADQITLEAETVGEALYKNLEVNNTWYGFTFAAQLNDDDLMAAGKFAQANKKLFGASVIKKSQLEWETSNVFKRMFDAQLDHVLPIFDVDNLYPAAGALSALLSMNFAAQNGTITLKFKTLPTITADDLTQTEYMKAKRLGINVYTYFDESPMIAEGMVSGGKFADEIVILDWFTDAVEKEVFNRLYKNKKIPLTDRGQSILIDAVEKVCAEGVNNGAFAPGKWTGEGFGALNNGDFLERGFYVWAAPMDTLSDSDREQRRATPIQVAVKLAGAIHFVDVLVNFNR